MSDPRDRDLEVALETLASAVEIPPAPDLAAGVVADIRSGRKPARELRVRWPRFAYAAAAIVALVALASVVLVFSPSTREAVADFLGIGGVRITYDETPNPSPETDTGLEPDLDVGREVTLAEAQELAPFDVGVPQMLGEPDAVAFDQAFAGGSVTLLYEPSSQLPSASTTRWGGLLTEFGTPLSPPLVKKLVSSGNTVQRVSVSGAEGYWIEGPHALLFLDADGRVHEERTRLAGNTLVWERNGITYRFESALNLDAALSIAVSIR